MQITPFLPYCRHYATSFAIRPWRNTSQQSQAPRRLIKGDCTDTDDSYKSIHPPTLHLRSLSNPMKSRCSSAKNFSSPTISPSPLAFCLAPACLGKPSGSVIRPVRKEATGIALPFGFSSLLFRNPRSNWAFSSVREMMPAAICWNRAHIKVVA